MVSYTNSSLNSLVSGLQNGSNLANAASYQDFQTALVLAQQQATQNAIQLKYQQDQQQAAMAQQQATAAALQQQIARNSLVSSANSQIAAYKQLNQFQNYFSEYNIGISLQNADALHRAAMNDLMTVDKVASNRAGQVRSAYAGGGILVDTGSAQDVKNQAVNETYAQGNQSYADKTNKINAIFSKVVSDKVVQYQNSQITQQNIDTLNQQLNNSGANTRTTTFSLGN